MVAWWTNRIDIDRNNDGVLHPVGKYFEELLPEGEVLERSFDEMFARLDAQIARDEARKQ
jgi:hypothetical protein